MDLLEVISHFAESDDKLIRNIDEFNKTVKHIVGLINDASILYLAGSYPSSVFLGITALEEVAKAHYGLHTDGDHAQKKRNNIFLDHKAKHSIAAASTIASGSRLADAIGKDQQRRLMNLAQNAGLKKIRESAIYFQRENDVIVVPEEKIDKLFARSLVLFAIEAFDDALVGYTEYTYEAREITDNHFEKLRNF